MEKEKKTSLKFTFSDFKNVKVKKDSLKKNKSSIFNLIKTKEPLRFYFLHFVTIFEKQIQIIFN